MINRNNIHVLLLLAIIGISAMSAFAGWTDNGIAVCSANGVQRTPAICSSDGLGSIIVWEDSRGGAKDIYIQKLDLNGDPIWAEDGIPVCEAVRDQWTPVTISDGEGGAIVIWSDGRANEFDVYIQRFDASGTPLWGSDGLAACQLSGDQWTPKLISDGAGGAILSWVDHRKGNYDIYAQKINPDGTIMWSANGVKICDDSARQDYVEMISEVTGGAIMTWEDRRNGARDIYAQRIDGNGNVRWINNGIEVCGAVGNQYLPQLVEGSCCGAIICWVDQRDGISKVYSQGVDSTGTTRWQENGEVVCSTGNTLDSSRLVSDGQNGAIITWEDRRSGERDIYAQRIDSSGTNQWTSNGIAVCTASSSQWTPQIVSDNSGGAIISWYDYRKGDYDIYVQRINNLGSVLWPNDGVAVCTASNNQWIHRSASDGTGGAYIVWEDGRNGSNIDLYAQRMDADGNVTLATLLQAWEITRTSSGITIHWTLSEVDEGVGFIVERSRDNAPFTIIASGLTMKHDYYCEYADNNCDPGSTYKYRVLYYSSEDSHLLFESGDVSLPATTTILGQNYPNPFNPSTTISWSIPSPCHVTIDIFDSAGRKVRRLFDETANNGDYTVSWDGINDRGNRVSSGVYYYRMKAGKETTSKKMVLTR